MQRTIFKFSIFKWISNAAAFNNNNRMINSHHHLSSKEVALNELKLNHKRYLEKSLLENVILEIINPVASDENTHVRADLDSQLLNKYLKSCVNDPQIEWPSESEHSLSSEAKSYLIERTDLILSDRCDSLENFISASSYNLDDLDVLMKETGKLSSETDVKYEHCVHIAVQLSSLIKEMLSSYRLDFYLKENQLTYENKLVECKTLLAKIRTVAGELLTDMYSPEKQAALGIVRNHLNLKTSLVKENLDRILESLNLFKSLGKEFEELVSTYKQTIEMRDRKLYSINKLNRKNDTF